MGDVNEKMVEALARDRARRRQERANTEGHWEGRSEPLAPELAWKDAAEDWRTEQRDLARHDLQIALAHDPVRAAAVRIDGSIGHALDAMTYTDGVTDFREVLEAWKGILERALEGER